MSNLLDDVGIRLIESVLAFLGAIFGSKIFEFFLEKIKDKKFRKKTLDIVDGLDDVSKIYHYMDSIIKTTTTDTLLLFRGSNGGGLPSPVTEFHVKATHQINADEDNSENLIEKYKSVLIDNNLTTNLRDIVTNGSIKFKVSDMPECLLKRMYMAENITFAELHYLGSKGLINKKQKFEIFYISIGTKKVHDFDTPEEKLSIKLAVDNIRQIFKKYQS